MIKMEASQIRGLRTMPEACAGNAGYRTALNSGRRK